MAHAREVLPTVYQPLKLEITPLNYCERQVLLLHGKSFFFFSFQERLGNDIMFAVRGCRGWGVLTGGLYMLHCVFLFHPACWRQYIDLQVGFPELYGFVRTCLYKHVHVNGVTFESLDQSGRAR